LLPLERGGLADSKSLQVNASIVDRCHDFGSHLLFHLLWPILFRIHQDLRLCAFKMRKSVVLKTFRFADQGIRLRADKLRVSIHD
jgi:hypothetical protein